MALAAVSRLRQVPRPRAGGDRSSWIIFRTRRASIHDVADREPTPEEQGKDPAAVARGRLGCAIGGKARAAKMTTSDLQELGRKAAQARWRRQ